MSEGSKALEGRTILITRDREGAVEFREAIEKEGGLARCFPVLKIEEPESWDLCDECLRNLDRYDAVAFTSSNGVSRFMSRADALSVPRDVFRQFRVYAVGEKTANTLRRFGLKGVLAPPTFSAKVLGTLLTRETAEGRRFLLPQGNMARKELEGELRNLGANVVTVVVYRTLEVIPDDAKSLVSDLELGSIDVVTFASPSAARGFFAATRSGRVFRDEKKSVIATIGATTSDEVRRFDVPVSIEASVATVSGLMEAVVDYFRTMQ